MLYLCLQVFVGDQEDTPLAGLREMPADRCARLTAVALANELHAVTMACQEFMIFFNLVFYFPLLKRSVTLFFWVFGGGGSEGWGGEGGIVACLTSQQVKGPYSASAIFDAIQISIVPRVFVPFD